MNDGAPFEAKLQEHLAAVRAAAQAAKVRVSQGVAGLSKPPVAAPPHGAEAPEEFEPTSGAGFRSAVNFDEPTTRVTAPFDPALTEIAEPAMDDDGIPVWEDPV